MRTQALPLSQGLSPPPPLYLELPELLVQLMLVQALLAKPLLSLLPLPLLSSPLLRSPLLVQRLPLLLSSVLPQYLRPQWTTHLEKRQTTHLTTHLAQARLQQVNLPAPPELREQCWLRLPLPRPPPPRPSHGDDAQSAGPEKSHGCQRGWQYLSSSVQTMPTRIRRISE